MTRYRSFELLPTRFCGDIVLRFLAAYRRDLSYERCFIFFFLLYAIDGHER